MANVDRTAVGAGAALLFAVGLKVVAGEGLTTALVPVLAGFGVLALAWDVGRLLRRAAVFIGSIVAMAGLLYGSPRPESAMVSPSMTPEQVEQARQLGSSSGFLEFLSSMIHFEFGMSVYYVVPVGVKVSERLPYTVVLLALALVLGAAIAGLLWWAARKSDRETAVEVIAHVGSGLSPAVWLFGFVVLAVTADLGSVSFGSSSIERQGAFSTGTATSLFYPALALALPTAGHLLRELLAAEGDAPGAGWSGPAFPGHWLPLSYLAGAVIVVESLYAVPGIGRLWVEGVVNQDVSVALVAAFALSVLGLFAFLVRDAALTATPGGVAPWSERNRPTPDGGQAAREGGEPPSLRAAVRESKRATLGGALLGITFLFAVYGWLVGPPTLTPEQIALRTPGFVDLSYALGSIVSVAGGGVVVAALVGVPAGAVLRGDGPARTAVRDLLRAVGALPLLLLVFYLLPQLFQHGLVGSQSSDTAIAIGVALAPFVALSTVDVVAGATSRAANGTSSGTRPGPSTDGGRPEPEQERGQRSRDAPGPEAGGGGRVHQEMPRRSSGPTATGGRAGPTVGSRPSYAPVAIPLCRYFGYAVFLVVAFETLGLAGAPGPRVGLSYTLNYLRNYLLTSATVPYVVLVLAVGLPVLGANLLADGLRETLQPWRTSDRAVGWPRHPRSGRRSAGGRAGTRAAPGGRQNSAGERPGSGPGTRHSRGQRQHPDEGRDGQRDAGPSRDDRR